MSKRTDKFNAGKLSSINFNVMVVGEPGCGKSTFSQFFAEAYMQKNSDGLLISDSLDCTVDFDERTTTTDDRLRKVLVQKHGEFVVASKSLRMAQEQNALDTRIHFLVYMFGPHHVYQTDRDCLRSVAGLVPVVPVLAKADSLTFVERQAYLQEIRALMVELDCNCDISVHFKFTGDEDAEKEEDSERSNGSDMRARNDADAVVGDSTPQLMDASISSFDHVSRDTDDASVGNAPISPISTGTPHEDRPAEQAPPPAHDPLQPAADAGVAPVASTSPAVSRPANIFALVCSASESGLREYPWGCSVSAYDERVSDFRRLQRLVFERGNIARLRHLTQSMTIALHTRKRENYNLMCTLCLVGVVVVAWGVLLFVLVRMPWQQMQVGVGASPVKPVDKPIEIQTVIRGGCRHP